MGYKKGSELADYYNRADVFCFPSTNDTFGIVMIEALSLGTPVAAYDVTGPKDIIVNGVNGHIGPDLSESINKCLSLNRRTVKKTSEQWTWENCWKIFKDNLIKARG